MMPQEISIDLNLNAGVYCADDEEIPKSKTDYTFKIKIINRNENQNANLNKASSSYSIGGNKHYKNPSLRSSTTIAHSNNPCKKSRNDSLLSEVNLTGNRKETMGNIYEDTNGTGEENPTAVFVPLDLLENYKDDTNGEKLEPSSNLIADVDIEPEDSKKEVI
ncbi:hypothetical protein QYM36_007688 [Artemia franciscana]|uniref:Uncharacterized protein n=1 Tax=Artemia franciscana TaxID=6661 RepID=A0AA88I9S4_ARTSF|nr:hypothetical protein QYM36_007688 [Artemia franciscana]